MLDDLAIINEACSRIGAEPLPSLDVDVFGGQAASDIYAAVIGLLLDAHPWTFAQDAPVQLGVVANAVPHPGYTFVHRLPTHASHPLRVYDQIGHDAPVADFVQIGRDLHTRASPVWVLCKGLREPDAWPGAFREAAVLALAAELALGLAGDKDLRERLRRDAYGTPSENFRGGALGVAIRAQGHGTPARKIMSGGPLLAAHRGAAW